MRRCTRDPDGGRLSVLPGILRRPPFGRPPLNLRKNEERFSYERFYRQHLDLKRWMRVVVDFGEDPAWVVTVTIQNHSPMESQ
jgi:hypothetical protein